MQKNKKQDKYNIKNRKNEKQQTVEIISKNIQNI